MNPETSLKNMFQEPPSTRSPEYRTVTGARRAFLPSHLNADEERAKEVKKKNKREGRLDLQEVGKPKSFMPFHVCLAPLLACDHISVLLRAKEAIFPMAPSVPHLGSRSPLNEHSCSVLPAVDTWIFPSIPAQKKCQWEHPTLDTQCVSQPNVHPAGRNPSQPNVPRLGERAETLLPTSNHSLYPSGQTRRIARHSPRKAAPRSF